MASKSIHNWRRYPSPNCYKIGENVRFWIWRCAVAPSEAAEKTAIYVHNYSPSSAQQPQRYLGKFFWCAQTCFFSRAIFVPPMRTLTMLLSALYSDLIAEEMFFIYVHIYVLGPKLLRLNFLQISQICIRSGAHKLFSPIFWVFAIFDHNFAKIVAPPSDENENENSLVLLKGLPKKAEI